VKRGKEEIMRSEMVGAAVIAAIAAHLGHRWARYIGYAWADLAQAVQAGLEGMDLLSIPGTPFVLRGLSPEEVDGLAALVREAVKKGYLALILEDETLATLTEHTYIPGAIPGIDSPGVRKLPYGGLKWGHTTTTGRGRFSLETGPSRVEFRFRVERGGDFIGLTAIEVYLLLQGDDVIVNHQLTPLAEERHREYAVDVLLGIAEELRRVPGAPTEAHLVAERLEALASKIGA
jgi:hypothetical protein